MADGKARRMWALPNAELTVPQALLMHGGAPDLVTIPCPAYLIEHEKGSGLVRHRLSPRGGG